MKKVARFMKDRSGVTAVEYALLAFLIALAIISSVQTIAPVLNAEFNQTAANL
ncbi:Flp family type IVb pilin [Rhodoblastus sp.]|uniref:Flp family type IVb pilin n=1 Tax=Rhodoblastus sp. TaxID=1962975 RepID=UPI003F9969AC